VTSETAFFVQGRAGEGAEVVTGSAVIALNPSGESDRSFGKGGQVATLGQVVGAGAGANEGLLVAGIKPRAPVSKEAKRPEEFYVARYTAVGKLDPSYANGSGIAALTPAGGAQAGAALFESDGRVLIGGLVKPRSAGCPHGYQCDRTPVVVRFTPDGRPDAGFGQGGIVLLSPLAARIGSPQLPLWRRGTRGPSGRRRLRGGGSRTRRPSSPRSAETAPSPATSAPEGSSPKAARRPPRRDRMPPASTISGRIIVVARLTRAFGCPTAW